MPMRTASANIVAALNRQRRKQVFRSEDLQRTFIPKILSGGTMTLVMTKVRSQIMPPHWAASSMATLVICPLRID